MRIPFKRKPSFGSEEFLNQHSRLLCASLVTIILVSCGAKVVEEQAVPNTTVTGQTAGVETSVDQPATRPQQAAGIEDRERRDADLVTSAREPSPSRTPYVTSDQTGRESDRFVDARQTESEVEEVLVTGASERRIEAFNQASGVAQTGQSVVVADSAASPAVFHSINPQHTTWHTGPATNRENYLEVEENNVKLVAENPVSTFSIDVDTAGYSNIRRMIMQEGRLPPQDAVRLEEMINYFSYDYASPENLEEPLAIHTELAASPWNPANKLLMVGMQGYEPAADVHPAANLVFLVDVSGSMNSPDKLGLVQRSLKLLVDQMRDTDRIALVVYAGAAGMVLDSTAAEHKNRIKHAIESLRAGGSTNGAAGIQLAYQIAERHKIDGGINRVIIASDGDLNVGVTSIDDLKELISKKRDNGIALTTLGYGTGNYNYSLMEQIADVGNGNAAYIDSLSEARKVLVEEMQSTLFTIAKDVKIQIEFNPSVVKEYRLLGYENRLLNREDFNNDKVDAGEIGAGHTVTALYEVTLMTSRSGLIPDSRYNPLPTVSEDQLRNELAFVKVRHKPADGDTSTESGRPVMLNDDLSEVETSDNFRFAAAVAGFGQLLRGGKYTHDWDYDDILNLARNSRGDDPNGYRSELVNLVEMAKLL